MDIRYTDIHTNINTYTKRIFIQRIRYREILSLFYPLYFCDLKEIYIHACNKCLVKMWNFIHFVINDNFFYQW